MKNKDIWDSSNSLVVNNKNLRKPIILLSIGVFFIMVALWVWVCFYGIMLRTYEPNSHYLVMFYEKHKNVFNYPELETRIKDMKNIKSYAIRYSCVNEKISNERFKVNGVEIVSNKKTTRYSSKEPGKNIKYYSDNSHSKVVGYATCIQLIDNNASSNNISIAEKNTIIKGETFRNDGKKQVLVSERFLNSYNLSSVSIIGSDLSLEIGYSNLQNLSQIADNDIIVGNSVDKEVFNLDIQIFQDFEVVGVFSDKILTYNNDSDLIISINSVDLSKFPIIEGQVFTYQNSNYESFSQKVTASGEFFPFMQNNMYISSWYEIINNKETASSPVLLYEAQLKSFSDAIDFDNKLVSLRKAPVFSSPLSEIVRFYKIGKIPTLLSAMFGLIFLIPISMKLSKIKLININEKNNMSKTSSQASVSYQNQCTLINFQIWNIFARAVLYAFIAVFIITCATVFIFSKVIVEKYLNNFVLSFIINFLISFIITVLLLSVVRFFINLNQKNCCRKLSN